MTFEDITLHDWQERALASFHVNRKFSRNFTAYVTPGAGKTLFALKAAHDLRAMPRDDGGVAKVIVVVHTENLRDQWQREAAKMHVPIQVWTYQQISSGWKTLSQQITGARVNKTLVIFDEIHHASHNQAWGEGLRLTFKNAVYRLLLTGTPFRHDDGRIPYLTYTNRIAQTDFSYGYREALEDGIVRPVYFPAYGGETRWRIGQQEFTKTFADAASEQEQQRRLNVALRATSDGWLSAVIAAAHARLLEVRQAHPNAGGLIVTTDQSHAQAVAKLIYSVTGCEPEIAISDFRDSSERINKFRESDQEWLIAVRMVTEGVDIPRLRVGIFATNVTTELFFRQWVGRYVRIDRDRAQDDQPSFLYIPADGRLTGYARALTEDRRHVLPDEVVIAEEHLARQGWSDRPVVLLGAMESSAQFGEMISHGAPGILPDELAFAERVRAALGLNFLTPEAIAAIGRAYLRGQS